MRWLTQNTDSITWLPPDFSANEWRQWGYVQKINVAGRREESMWYVVERPPLRLLPTLYTSHHEAKAAAQLKCTERGWARESPLLKTMLANVPPHSVLDGISASQAKEQCPVMVQAFVPYSWVAAVWQEHDCAQIFNVTTQQFYNGGDEALYAAVKRVVPPDAFVYGLVHRTDPQRIILVHNASAQLREKASAMHQLQAACANHQARIYLTVAPFQVAKTPKEAKLHARIFTEAYAGGVSYHAVG